jgi:hypothetical protein
MAKFSATTIALAHEALERYTDADPDTRPTGPREHRLVLWLMQEFPHYSRTTCTALLRAMDRRMPATESNKWSV